MGLASHLAGAEPRGAHLENLVLLDLLVRRDSARHLAAEVPYWRTTTGDEVDFVVEQGEKLLATEIKTAGRPRSADARHLRTFAEQYPDRLHGPLVLHDGDEITWLGKGILAVPWWRVVQRRCSQGTEVVEAAGLAEGCGDPEDDAQGPWIMAEASADEEGR